MKTATEDLVHEHKAILSALNVIEKMKERLEAGRTTDRSDIDDMIGFLKEFADKCHHGKEEDFLIPAIKNAGILKDDKPINAMLSEHKLGRDLIRDMQESISGTQVSKTKFIGSSSAYIKLLREHIIKEDTLLFPIVDARMTEENKDLFNKFQEFEEKVIGPGRHEELHHILEKMRGKYLA